MTQIEKIDLGKLTKGALDITKRIGKAGVDYCKQNPEACATLAKGVAEKAVSRGKGASPQPQPAPPPKNTEDWRKEVDNQVNQIAKVWEDLKGNPALLATFIELLLNSYHQAVNDFIGRLRGTPDEKAYETLLKYSGLSPYRKTGRDLARQWQWHQDMKQYKDDGLKFLIFARALAQGKIDDAKRAFEQMSSKAQEEIRNNLFPVIGFSFPGEEAGERKGEKGKTEIKPQTQNYMLLAIVGVALIVVLVVAFMMFRKKK